MIYYKIYLGLQDVVHQQAQSQRTWHLAEVRERPTFIAISLVRSSYSAIAQEIVINYSFQNLTLSQNSALVQLSATLQIHPTSQAL